MTIIGFVFEFNCIIVAVEIFFNKLKAKISINQMLKVIIGEFLK